MKKILIFVFVIVLASCSAAEDVPANEWQPPVDYEITDTIMGHGHRLKVEFLEQLMGQSKLWDIGGVWSANIYARTAVIGEFIDIAETWFIYEYSEHFGKEIATGVRAKAPFLVTEVLYGDLEVGDVIHIMQHYAFEEERGILITRSELAPMHKGDRWIYFINGARGVYESAATIDSRFPIPNGEIMQLLGELLELRDAKDETLRTAERVDAGEWGDGWHYSRDSAGNLYRFDERIIGELDNILIKERELLKNADASAFGLLDRYAFNYSVYAEVIEHFGIKTQDWVNPGREFDAMLIEFREKGIREAHRSMNADCECC